MAAVTLVIVLSVILIIIMITLAVVLYKKRSYITQRNAKHIWHDFVMIDSPDYMIALKNSDSLSFDSRRRRSSIPMFHHNGKPPMPDQHPGMSAITREAKSGGFVTGENNGFLGATPALQSPAPVFMPALILPNSPNKKII
ncbi:hypothetical protein BD408DRAFT_427604 [Parasitella parasitica]|nr:hypothetical protein BD408DRAFT_427604 [Parasitella parasitica]